jgi:protein-disulfide isomerase-like protein with CxxC motif
MIYLTANGLTPGGSSTHLHTKQYIEQHNQTIKRTTHYRYKQYMKQYNSRIRKSVGRAPSLRGISWHLPYN